MIRLRADIPDIAFARTLPEDIQRRFRVLLQTSVKPALQTEVKSTLGVEARPVVRPFQFATDKSRRAYFATKGFGKGIPYSRTHQLETSWFVAVGYQFRSDAVSLYNSKAYAKYVYGSPTQLPTPGHVKTGWPAILSSGVTVLFAHAQVLVKSAWRQAFIDSMQDSTR